MPEVSAEPDEREPLAELLRDLRCTREGLTSREAARRLVVHGPNELVQGARRHRAAELAAQFTQPLALLLVLASGLAWLGGTPELAVTIAMVVVLNAMFAFWQEVQAERAVEALAGYLPARVDVLRDARWSEVDVRELVPGDVMRVSEGARVSADGRILDGSVTMDLAALTGESVPVVRSASAGGPIDTVLTEAQDLVFSGTTCTGGDARVLVVRTGMHSELGRIAALTQRTRTRPSPLERQVRRATWAIAAVAVGAGVAFLPLGVVAGLGWSAAIAFAIGLIVANVPEGLLPTITLALADGVRELARRGAVMKRLSAVETLGSVQVICTDKTGTLTQNRMRVARSWTDGMDADVDDDTDRTAVRDPLQVMAAAAARCTTASPPDVDHPDGVGDPTELALLHLAAELGVTPGSPAVRTLFQFDPALQRMTVVLDGAVSTKGAPESVVPCCTRILRGAGEDVLDEDARALVRAAVESYAADGLRVLAVARRTMTVHERTDERSEVERDLTLLGLVALRDPVRPRVASAVAAAHAAGIRVHIITGDHGLTASAVARAAGIGMPGLQVVTGAELETMPEADLDALLLSGQELIFARCSPEAKLRICEALQATGHVVAMTGDGVNDAPALRHADIGVAMGASGTDVAREAATMVLTDDDFATIVSAVDAGRRVFDNVRKFVLYIFAHAVPEVVPFAVFALSGGAIPLPLTVLQILAIDLGTETLPALALGREPAEPGLMERPPRPQRQGVIDRRLLLRAWGLMGVVSAALVMAGFFAVLLWAGWRWGEDTGPGTALHHSYEQATTMTFAGIVACQVGVAFAARTEHASLRQIGVTSNPMLLWGIAFELVFTAAVIYLPPLQGVFGTAPLSAGHLLLLLPFPFVVWGVDEVWRAVGRRRENLSRAVPQVDPATAR